jgi:Family of unknown function (DUF6508)
MSGLQNFEQHLQTLAKSDWEKLFNLLPENEGSKKFGEVKRGNPKNGSSISFPYLDDTEVVDDVLEKIYELQLLPVFDWTSWEEGKSLINNHANDYTHLDTITLCKLLTTIIRADKFNDGFLVMNFENGVIPKILKAMQNNLMNGG